MKSFRTYLYLVLPLCIFIACAGQNKVESQISGSGDQSSDHSGVVYKMSSGNCEDCELMIVGMPEKINSIDTTDGWFENGQKLVITGRALKEDKSTPAPDVILYYYHTDQNGIYAPDKNTDRDAQRHGRLRGWVRTGRDGLFSIYTIRPAQYPGNKIEAHIHVIVKEPDIDLPYWIDAWVFDDDPLLTKELRNRLENHGGSGILKTRLDQDIQIADHDVILGLNIPGYPVRN